MRLLRHEMAGFNHLTGPFILDTRSLPEGIIALVGANGAGKTSHGTDGVFAAIYGPGEQRRAFPSREGSLASYATAKHAYIDDLWDLGDLGTFHIRVNVSGTAKTTSASLKRILPDGTSISLNDGKTTTFRAEIAKLFPSQRSLLASAFSGQNRRGSFGDLDQGERMKLFVELTDLAHLEEKAETARRCQKIADGLAARLRSALDVLRRDATPEALETIVSRLTSLDAVIVAEESERQARASVIETLTRDRVALVDDADRYIAAAVRLSSAAKAEASTALALNTQEVEARRIQPEHDAEVKAITDRYSATIASIGRRRTTATAAHEKAQADRRERIQNNREKVLGERDAIKAAAARVSAIEVEIEALRTEGEGATRAGVAAQEKINTLKIDLRTAQDAERAIAIAKDRAALLGTVKFGDECGVDPACPLVLDAVAARDSILELEAVAAKAPALVEEIAGWTRTLDAAKQRGTAATEAIATLTAESKVLRPKALLLPSLAHADEKIAEYERDIANADKAQADALEAWLDEERQAASVRDAEQEQAVGRLAERRKASLDARRRLESTLAADREGLRAAEAEVAALAGAKATLDGLDAKLGSAREALAGTVAGLARLTAERDAAERSRQEIERRMADAAETAGRLRAIEDAMLAWQSVARTLGKDGLQRLEVDAAGPVVSDLINKLLEVGYGTRFSVQLVTQVATARGDGTKEKFTIDVLDNEHGGEVRDLGDLSGGERVIIDEAIRAGIACYKNLQNRQRIRTIFRDETTGALDEENGPKYIAMLRKLRELCGADQIFFISHSPVARALADAEVEVADGKVVNVRLAA